MTSDWDAFGLGGELSPAQVDDLKAEHGPIFKATVDGTAHYFRTLTRRDAVELGLSDGELDPETEEAVFQRVLVYPQKVVDFNELSAGAPSMVAQEVLKRSGLFGSEWLNQYIGRARARMTVYHTITATILAGFPTLLPGALDDLNVEQLMDLLVEAEEILALKARVNRGIYVPLEFVDNNGSSHQMDDADRDAMVRAMLEGGMEDVPAGWIDRTKKRPVFATDIPNPTEDI